MSAGNTLWPLGDHLGTLRDLADFTGTVFTITNHRVFDTFGRLTSETNSSVDSHFAFTGRFFDDLGDTELSTSLSHHWNRWYDPQLGKWLSEDPIAFAGGDVNLGRYVGNHATGAVDWSGWYQDGGTPPGSDEQILVIGYAVPGNRVFQPVPESLQPRRKETGDSTTVPLSTPSRADFLDEAAGFSAGLGDAMSLGLGWVVRELILGIDTVDYEGAGYYYGGWGGVVVDLGAGGLTALPKAGAKSVLKFIGKEGIETIARESAEVVAKDADRLASRNLPKVFLDWVESSSLPYRVTPTLQVRLSRFFATQTGYQQVIKQSPIIRWLRSHGWQAHHWAIPRSAGRAGSEGLRRLTEAGWNIVPLPAVWNRAISDGGVGYNATRIFVGVSPFSTFGSGYMIGNASYEAVEWLWDDDD